MKSPSFSFRAFLRNESGSAYITFGLGLIIVMLPIFGLLFSHGGPNFLWQTGTRETLERESAVLTEQYTKLWLKVAAGENISNLPESSDETMDQGIFRNDISFYADNVDKESEKAGNQALKEMNTWLKGSLIKSDPVKFKDTKTVAITQSCLNGKKVLIFRATADQTGVFIRNNKEMSVVVKRITQVPCDIASISFNSPSASGPAVHECVSPEGFKGFSGTVSGSSSATLASGGSSTGGDGVRSIVNFAWSLDEASRKAIGDDNLKIMTQTLGGTAANFTDWKQVATGLVLGNFPMEGGGLGECEKVSGNFAHSGSCYDKSKGLNSTNYKTETLGLQNISRKTPFEGLIHAQYTRYCPKDPVWTYQTETAGNCYKDTDRVEYPAVGAYRWADSPPDVNSFGFQNADDLCGNNELNSATNHEWINAVNMADTSPGNQWNIDQCNAQTKDGSTCYHVGRQARCLYNDRSWETVYKGHWIQACPAVQLASSGGGGGTQTCAEWNTNTFPSTVGAPQSADFQPDTPYGSHPPSTVDAYLYWYANVCTPFVAAYETANYKGVPTPNNPVTGPNSGNYCIGYVVSCKTPGTTGPVTTAKDDSYFRRADELISFTATLVKDLNWVDVPAAKAVTLTAQPIYEGKATKAVDDSDQARELNALHPKNTDRYLTWGCDTGPVKAGNIVANSGHLSAPYGAGVNKDLMNNCQAVSYTTPNGTPGNYYTNCTSTDLAKKQPVNVGEYNASTGSKNRTTTCAIPEMTDPEKSLAAFKLSFNRTCSGTVCDYPEGFYQISLNNKGLKTYGGTPTDAQKYPTDTSNKLNTTWETMTGNGKWAWADVGTIDTLGTACPIKSRTAETFCGNNGCQTYYTNVVYNTTQEAAGATCAGGKCPNVSEFILKGSDQYTSLNPEVLNVSSVSMERRRDIPSSELTAATRNAKPLVCTFDTADQRGNGGDRRNAVLRKGEQDCDWSKGIFCNSSGSRRVTEVEHQFLDEQMADKAIGNPGNGVTNHGAFALTASNIPSGGLVIGDEDDTKVTYNPRRVNKTAAYQKKDAVSGLNLSLVQIQTLDVARINNSDYAPHNLPIAVNTSGVSGTIGAPDLTGSDYSKPFERLLGTLGYGYKNFVIVDDHRANQCALVKQAARVLANSDGGAKKSKVLVYIGAIGINEDVKNRSGRFAFSNVTSNKPGTLTSGALTLGAVNNLDVTDSNFATDTAECLKNIDETNKELTMFVVTGVPETATGATRTAYINAIEDTLEELEKTKTEICNQPFCVFGMKPGDAHYDDYATTPETCAANLFSCMKPPLIK